MPFQLVMQAPEKLSVVMDDGFNVVQYTFHLQSVNEATTSVCCEVKHYSPQPLLKYKPGYSRPVLCKSCSSRGSCFYMADLKQKMLSVRVGEDSVDSFVTFMTGRVQNQAGQ